MNVPGGVLTADESQLTHCEGPTTHPDAPTLSATALLSHLQQLLGPVQTQQFCPAVCLGAARLCLGGGAGVWEGVGWAWSDL